MEWVQVYNPLGNAVLSTLAAALPIVLLLFTLAILEIAAWRAALIGLLSAVGISIWIYGMPAGAATAASINGIAYGLFPIGWIVLNAVFLYDLTVASGTFETVKASVAQLSGDRRIQALLVCFSFGAFVEGAAGFGTPVAICSALMIGLGFPPISAAVLCLIANTAPVAFGAIGTPINTLAAITGISPRLLAAMAGRQLMPVSILIPIWIVVMMSGWKGLRGIWPVALMSGCSFAIVQLFWSNYIGPELVNIVGGIVSLVATVIFCTYWRPKEMHTTAGGATSVNAASADPSSRGSVIHAWMPWLFLSVFVMIWGLAPVKKALGSGPVLAPTFDVPGLHKMVYRDYPVEPVPADRAQLANPEYKSKRAEAARFTLNWVSATGSGILLASIATALYLRIRPRRFLTIAGKTFWRMKWSLITIALMMSLGFITRYGGTDATLGLAFTKTGVMYPFFAALLGWLGVALTGSDTSSNVLFGSLQKITAQQLGLNPVLICAANSTGGVMGKMIDAQSIVVATASTGQTGGEGRILRAVFWHSLALAGIMGVIVMLQAYVFPWMVPSAP
jgi:lactate permease